MRLQGVEELQLARDEVALQTMEAYFDVVYYTGSVRLAREQLETSAAELAKSRKLSNWGLKAPPTSPRSSRSALRTTTW